MTPREVITSARELIVDEGPSPELPDSVFLGFLNQAINRVAVRRPDFFVATTGPGNPLPARAESLIQDIDAVDGTRLVDVVGTYRTGLADLNLVKESEYEALQDSLCGPPSASSDVERAILPDYKVWIRYPKFPTVFFLYPAPKEGDMLRLLYSRPPKPATLEMTAAQFNEVLTSVIHPALVYCVASLAESRNSEKRTFEQHVIVWKNWFEEELMRDIDGRKIVDLPDANVMQAMASAAASAR